MKLSKKILLFILMSFTVVAVYAQQSISVNAKIDSVQMWIGNQTRLRFEVNQSVKQKVTFPLFSDTIVGSLDIVKPAEIDTQKISDDRINVNANYIVTSFQDSLIYIPKFPFVVDGDTVWSNSLSIKVVQPFVVDTTSQQLADIKPIYNPPFDWKGVLQDIALVLLILVLLVLAYLLIKKYTKKSITKQEKPTEPKLPAHIEALQHLDRIKEEKIWQRGRVKEYHVELTDVIRHYINRMFNINSMEMTTDEILLRVKFLQVDKKGAYEALRQILQLADLAKFAKWEPETAENEMSLMNAYLFVNQTKIEERETLQSKSNNSKSNKEV